MQGYIIYLHYLTRKLGLIIISLYVTPKIITIISFASFNKIEQESGHRKQAIIKDRKWL